MNPKFWWYASRSTGLVAWGAAAISVLLGLLLSTRSARGLVRPAWVLDLHRFVGALTVVVTLAHMGTLVADNYVHFGAADLLVPWASSYKTGAIALGIVAFWLFVLVELTSLARKQLPRRVWATIHLSSFVAYALATFHYLEAGTERTNPVVLLVVEVTTAAVLFFTVLRILITRGPAARAPRQRDSVGVGGGE